MSAAIAPRPQRQRKAPERFEGEGGSDKTAKKRKSPEPKAGAKGKKGGKPKRAKKASKKDPNKPKKNMSAYMFYCQERRPQMKKDNPELKFTEITKLISPEWKALSKDDKKKYDDLAAKDKERYQKEMEEYNAKKGSDDDAGDHEDDEGDDDEDGE